MANKDTAHGIEVEYPHGVRFPGRSGVAEIIKKLEWMKGRTLDVVVRSDNMTLVPDEEHGFLLNTKVEVDGVQQTYAQPLSGPCLQQILSDIGLPKRSRLWQRFRYGVPQSSSQVTRQRQRGRLRHDTTRNYEAFTDMVNDIWRTEKLDRLVRGFRNENDDWYWRAFLSANYLIVPNDTLLFALAEKLQELDAEIWDARLSETHFAVYSVAPGISGQVDLSNLEGEFWKGEANDPANPAIMVSNSETGHGGFDIHVAIFLAVGRNYIPIQQKVAQRHVGKKHEVDALLSRETVEKRNDLIVSMMQDITAGVFEIDAFEEFITILNQATIDPIGDAFEAAEALKVVLDISEKRKAEILQRMLQTAGKRDVTRFEAVEAITHVAHDGRDVSASEGMHMEQVGSRLLTKLTGSSLMKEFEKQRADVPEEDDEPVLSGAASGLV